ncbi:unnamed protein product [Adineta steineri]|uniref:Serine protease n=1 Tax=Adineta steineri TaxID=433720 RepID=A0A819S484_9BILA|nr:unnamed protein product [Adineta steineri]
MNFLITYLFLSIGVLMAQDEFNTNVSINSAVVIRSRSMSVDFWTPERMKAAKEPVVILPPNGKNTSRSLSISNNGPQATILGRTPAATSPLGRALNVRGRYVATTGRVFWSCTANIMSYCSASVIASTSGDVIVTAGHCVYDTSTLQWLTSCNWIFVPAYYNGTAPYGKWPAREVTALTSWTQSSPNYNYDVGFVALSLLNGRHITEITGSQSVGFNYPRNQPTYSFGYPLNLDQGEILQVCSGIPGASKYTTNSYAGQGLSNCYMTGGCSGGPWLQQFDESTGIGVTYSVNSFTYSLAPNTINGPVFDSNIQSLWNYITAR